MSGHVGGNRRGRRSREEILDAASRTMAEHGYAATSLSMLVEKSGLTKGSIYHHFSSKEGLLTAVMARGAYQFFDAMQAATQGGPGAGSARERLEWLLLRAGEVFLAQPDFLRLHLTLLLSSGDVEEEVFAMIAQVRQDGRDHMRDMIASAFAAQGDRIAHAIGTDLAHFGLAGFDGFFIALQAEPDRAMADQMRTLSEAIAALGEQRAARMRAADRRSRAVPPTASSSARGSGSGRRRTAPRPE